MKDTEPDNCKKQSVRLWIWYNKGTELTWRDEKNMKNKGTRKETEKKNISESFSLENVHLETY